MMHWCESASPSKSAESVDPNLVRTLIGKRKRKSEVQTYCQTEICPIFRFDSHFHRHRKQNPDLSRMDPEAARTARNSLELVFHMSNILDTGLDRHSLSVLVSLCDLGVNPEALAAVIKELRQENPSSSQQNKMGSSVP